MNFAHTLPHDDTSTEFHTETGPFTVVPLAGNRSSLVWVDRPAEPPSARSKLAPDALSAAIEERSAAILGTVTVEGPAQVFPLSGMNARRFAAGRAVLVGEAAHLFPPIGAQGLNLGYRDVAALGRDPRRSPPRPGRRRRPRRVRPRPPRRRAQPHRRGRRANRTLLSGFLPVQAARGFGLFLLDQVPALRRAMMRQGVAAG